jgi:hypothetical protein
VTATREQVLAVARGELGEEEIPHGSNNVKYSRWYGMVGSPWCGMFVSWVAAMAHATDIIPRFAYTPSGAAWFKAKGRFAHIPHVGSIVFYQFPGIDRISHTGIVETVYADGSWVAIEGNTDELGGRTGGKVMRKHRYSLGAQGGFGNPAYAASGPVVVGSHGNPALLSVRAWQQLLEFAPSRQDGIFGPDTRQRSEWMRTAARCCDTTMPGHSATSTIQLIQRIVDTPDDGVWGPNTRARVHSWTRQAQGFLGVSVDGAWGPHTDAAYITFRNAKYRP